MACFSSWRTGFSLGSQLLVKMSRDQFLFVLAIVDELAKIKVAVFFFFSEKQSLEIWTLEGKCFLLPLEQKEEVLFLKA